MSNITLSMPDKISRNMKLFPEVKWSEVARQAIISRLETLQLAEKLARKSKLTKRDVTQFSKKIKALATKRFLA